MFFHEYLETNKITPDEIQNIYWKNGLFHGNPKKHERILRTDIIDYGDKCYVKVIYINDTCPKDVKILHQCRGIIYLYNKNTMKYKVVCYPFDRFFNHTAPQSVDIDLSSCRIEEKLDGLLIMLWWDEINGKWRYSTKSKIIPMRELQYSIYTMLKRFDILPNSLEKHNVDKSNTYMFEMYHHSHRIKVFYTKEFIAHIGTRSNITLKEKRYDFPIPLMKPKTYIFDNIDDMVNYRSENFEGFVAVTDDYERQKIKVLSYFTSKSLNITPYSIILYYYNSQIEDVLNDVYYEFASYMKMLLKDSLSKLKRYIYGSFHTIKESHKKPDDAIRSNDVDNAFKKYIHKIYTLNNKDMYVYIDNIVIPEMIQTTYIKRWAKKHL